MLLAIHYFLLLLLHVVEMDSSCVTTKCITGDVLMGEMFDFIFIWTCRDVNICRDVLFLETLCQQMDELSCFKLILLFVFFP